MPNLFNRLFARYYPRPPEDFWNGPVTFVLRVHPDVFKLSCLAFGRTATRRQECGLFWYGVRSEKNATVAAVVVPEQICRAGNYQVSGEAMEAVSDRTRPHGWRNITQCHTHPGDWVGHSPYDDEQAISRHALSLVFPRYGAPIKNWRHGVGVHEYIAGRWRRWSIPRCTERVQLDPALPIPEIIDLRAAP